MSMFDEALNDSAGMGDEMATPAAAEDQGQETTQSLPEPTPEPERQVPLKALEAERHRRQEFEAQIRQQQQQIDLLIQSLQRTSPPVEKPRQKQPDVLLEPEKWQETLYESVSNLVEQRLAQTRIEVTEEAMRDKHADYDQLIDGVFRPAAQSDPALFQQMLNAKNPAKFAYQHAKRMQAEKELGGEMDIGKLKEKIRAELLAELAGKKEELAAGVGKVPVSFGNVGTTRSADSASSDVRPRDMYRR